MHVVYLVRIHREELPNKYIGSKTNCEYKDGMLIQSNGKEYWGSSKDEEYHSLIADKTIRKSIEILDVQDSPISALTSEREYHIEYDVLGNPEYFNKSIAMVNTFSLPNYATYKHSITGKVKRLPRDHPRVLSKEWVGVTKDVPMPNDVKEVLKEWNEINGNPFKDMKHSEESRKKISDGVYRWLDNMTEEERKLHSEKLSNLCRSTFTGRIQSEEEKAKRRESRKGKVVIVNIQTSETKLIDRETYDDYDSSIWWTQSKYQYHNKKRYVNIETKEHKYFEENPDESIWILSEEYYRLNKMGTEICKNCGVEFEYEKYRSTCSEECVNEIRSKSSTISGKANKGRKRYRNKHTGEFKHFREEPDLNIWVWWSDPNRVIATKTCIICGNDFDILKKQKYLRDTCTRECANVHSSQQMAQKRYYNED